MLVPSSSFNLGRQVKEIGSVQTLIRQDPRNDPADLESSGWGLRRVSQVLAIRTE
jgi:hypothetical protein